MVCVLTRVAHAEARAPDLSAVFPTHPRELFVSSLVLRQAECDADGAAAAEGARLKDRVMVEVDAEIQAAGDQMGGVVAKHAASCSLCRLAMDIMFTTYGSEVGVAALKYIPYGGLYIAGGIAPKNVDYLTAPDSKFLQAFRDKVRARVRRCGCVRRVLAGNSHLSPSPSLGRTDPVVWRLASECVFLPWARHTSRGACRAC